MDSLTRSVRSLDVSLSKTDAPSALLNVFETLLNLAYLYAAHINAWAPAPLIGFTAASLTLAKTVLYWAQEYYCNYCAVGHNSLRDLIQYWIIPNGWVCIARVSRRHSKFTYSRWLFAASGSSSRASLCGGWARILWRI